MPRVDIKPPNEQHTQSVLFAKGKFSKAQSKAWLQERGYYTDGYDEGESYHRWRQYDPNSDRFRYRQKEIDKGIKLVIAFFK